MTHKVYGARLALLPVLEGGLRLGMHSGYRGVARFAEGQQFGIELTFPSKLEPGDVGEVHGRVWAGDALPDFEPGQRFEVLEGPRIVGTGSLISRPVADPSRDIARR